jgi:hypothetical protein
MHGSNLNSIFVFMSELEFFWLMKVLTQNLNIVDQGFFLGCMQPESTQKKFPCYKRYKNSRMFLDEKAKCKPWITNIWMKKPKLDENRLTIGENFILHP